MQNLQALCLSIANSDPFCPNPSSAFDTHVIMIVFTIFLGFCTLACFSYAWRRYRYIVTIDELKISWYKRHRHLFAILIGFTCCIGFGYGIYYTIHIFTACS